MAVAAFGRFSIREYTAVMRKADVSKCWPFGMDVRESLMPPIECPRYRWWSSELQISRSAEVCHGATESIEPDRAGGSCDASPVVAGVEEVCQGEASRMDGDVEAVTRPGVLLLPSKTFTMEEDGEGQTKSPGKAKMRTPKRRSIVELFSVAPQIEAAGEEEKGDNEKGEIGEVGASKETHYDEELDWCPSEGRRKRKKGCTKMRMRKTAKRNGVKTIIAVEEKLIKKIRNKERRFQRKHQKRKNSFADGITEEEKISKSSSESPVDLPQLDCGSTVTDISAKTKNTSKPEEEDRAPRAENLKVFTRRNPQNHQTDMNVSLPQENEDRSIRSSHMQSLCRVFSDVLAASSAAQISSEDLAAREKVNVEKSQPLIDAQGLTNHTGRKKSCVDLVDLNSPAEPIEETVLTTRCPPFVGPSSLSSSSSSSLMVHGQEKHHDRAYPCSQKEGMMNPMYHTWLTRESTQKDTLIITGLPLNSRGELMHMQTCTRGRSDEINKMKSHVAVPPAHSFAAVENPFRPQLPTVRLMGTDVTVGMTSKEQEGLGGAFSPRNECYGRYDDPSTSGSCRPFNITSGYKPPTAVSFEEAVRQSPWNHLQFAQWPAVREGGPRSSFLLGLPAAASSRDIAFQPAAKCTSLASFDLTNKGRETVFAFGRGELLPIYGKNAYNDGRAAACLSRPVKLSAGAKHILKPGLKMMDQDKTLGAHPNVPFSWERASGEVPAPRENAARVYQL